MNQRFRWSTCKVTCAVVILLAGAVGSKAQTAPFLTKCELALPNGVSAPEGPAVFTGTDYKVPNLRFRFVNWPHEPPSLVRVFYGWQWWEYPYPNHPRGVWSDANDIVECTSFGPEQILIPSYNVKPKGWYSGRYARVPRFNHIEVGFETKVCGSPRLIFSKREVEMFKDHVANVSFTCGGIATYKFADD